MCFFISSQIVSTSPLEYKLHKDKTLCLGNSLAVQWLGLPCIHCSASTEGGLGSIPGQGTKILQAWSFSMVKRQQQKTFICLICHFPQGLEHFLINNNNKANIYRVYYLPGPDLSILHHLIIIITHNRYSQYPHFTKEGTKALRSELTGPRSCS